MPQLDNRYPVTYDGVDPLTILPSLNPYEGYPIKRISASQDLAVIACIRGEDEHPYLSSIPATPILLKASYLTGNKTGFFVPSNTFAKGYHYTQTYVGGAGSNVLPGYIGGQAQPGGNGTANPGYVRKPAISYLQAGSRLASLDDVFYDRYIKNYLQYVSSPNPNIPVGVYSPPGGHEFLGISPYEVGPAPALNSASFAQSNVTTLKTVYAYSGGYAYYNKWKPGASTTVPSFLTTNTENYAPTQTTQKYGAVEGWHTALSTSVLYAGEISNGSTYWGSYFATTGQVPNQKYYKDYFSRLGTSDAAAPSQITTDLDGESSWIFMCYAMPQRPATDFAVYKKTATSYEQEVIELEDEIIGASKQIQIAKEVSVSPNGRCLLIATDSQTTGFTIPRLQREKVLLLKRGFVLGSTIWRNAFLSSGNFPTSSQSAINVSSDFTMPGTGNWTQNPITAGVDTPLNYGQFNSIAVSNEADWVLGNNYGYTRRSLATGTHSALESDIHSIIPSAPRAISKNLAHVSTPTIGSEPGDAGSPTIAMAVSNNGVVVKSERVVPGRLPFVRVPITALIGSDTIEVTFPSADVKDALQAASGAIYFGNNQFLSGGRLTSVTFDIDVGGTLPTIAPVACTCPAIIGGGISTFLAPGHCFNNNDMVEFTAVGAGSIGIGVGTNYWVTQVSAGSTFKLVEEATTNDPATYPAANKLLTAGSFVKLSRGIQAGRSLVAIVTDWGYGTGALTATMFLGSLSTATIGSAIRFSSIGSGAYLLIHYSNILGTRLPLYRTDGSYRGEVGTPVPRRSATNMNSYATGTEAIVTIDGQQVIPASPISLNNSFYGPFGACVAIDEDGETVAVSSPSEGYDESALSAPPCEGAVYIYKKLAGEGGGAQWEQTNRITVPRIADYFIGLLGATPHIQFGSSLEFAGSNLLIGSRQGVYIFELAVGLYGAIKTQADDEPQVGSLATEHKTTLTGVLDFVAYTQVFANATTSTRLNATLSGCGIPLAKTLALSTAIQADLENPTTVLIEATALTNTRLAANLTFASKMTINARLQSRSTMVSELRLSVQALTSSGISGKSTISANLLGPIGVESEINLGGRYAGTLIKSYVIPAQLNMSSSLQITDDLFRINPLGMESSAYTSTSIAAELGYVKIELAAILSNATSVAISVAKLTFLGTSDPRQASIFEVGRASSGTIGGLGQRWVKRSDLQNSDLTTSVEWVEGEPPQLD